MEILSEALQVYINTSAVLGNESTSQRQRPQIAQGANNNRRMGAYGSHSHIYIILHELI